ncbi:hypothetical protein KUCAC02_036067, partial [Chaenocephalus aceratus]
LKIRSSGWGLERITSSSQWSRDHKRENGGTVEILPGVDDQIPLECADSDCCSCSRGEGSTTTTCRGTAKMMSIGFFFV